MGQERDHQRIIVNLSKKNVELQQEVNQLKDKVASEKQKRVAAEAKYQRVCRRGRKLFDDVDLTAQDWSKNLADYQGGMAHTKLRD